MSWLKIDDGFANHPKIAKLSDRELRIWIRTLCYCARYENPTIGDEAMQEVVGLKPAMVQTFVSAGLVDVVGGNMEVHDWKHYQPKDKTGAARQKKWRDRNGPVTENVTDESLPRPVPSRKDLKAVVDQSLRSVS